MVQLATGWSKGQRALLRFLEQQGVLGEEPVAPADTRPSNADLFATFAASIDQQRLVDLVSAALRIAQVDLGTFTPMPDLVSLIPADVACSGEVVAIAQHDGLLEVAAANPLDLEMVKSVEFTTGLRVRTKIARREDVCRALSEAYGVSMPEATPVEHGVVPPQADGPPETEAPTHAAFDPVPADVDTAGPSSETPNEPVSGEPIRWSFGTTDEPAAPAAADEPVADVAVVPEDASGEASASWDMATPSDEDVGDAAEDDPDANVPVYELDMSLDDAAVIDLALVDDVRLDDESDGGVHTPVDPADAPVEEATAPIGTMSIEPATGFERFPERAPLDEPLRLEPASPEPDAGWLDAESVSFESEIAEPESASDPESAAGAAVTPASGVLTARPGVLVVSRDVGRRIALRDALEVATGLLCVLTMRDETEARAVLGLGGVAAAVVDANVVGRDGRPLWETVRDHGTNVIVYGGNVTATGVVAMERDVSPLEIASRVRSIVKESLDG